MFGALKSLAYYFYGKMPEKSGEAISALKLAAEQRGDLSKLYARIRLI